MDLNNILIIYPTQLFEFNELLKLSTHIFLIEEPIYFTKFKFHKLKLIFHRASMKYYYDHITNIIKHNNIKYINFYDVDYDAIFKKFPKKHNLIIYDPVDIQLEKKIKKFANKYDINVTIYNTPLFLETIDDLINYKNTIKNNKFYHDNFYKWQRKRLNILMDNDKPLYGKWSFDTENRKKFDNNYNEHQLPTINNDYIIEAKKYITTHFTDNFGDTDDFIYPITYTSVKKHFKLFLKNKLALFGPFQDAVSKDINFGSHSILSPLLNVGLITVDYVIKKTLKIFNNHSETDKKKIINSVEGFLRQIIGWRSFTRFMYLFFGDDMMKMNALNHKNKLNSKWFDASTNIYPIDFMINKVKKYAYLHHIERLMYIGNFSLLTNINPIEIYKWFMICFIDSFEWVMVSNVMGMSQYALTDISMMTRPYFSSSNYILKLSNFKCTNNDDWCEIWNALYYKFIYDNLDEFKRNYAIAPSVKHWLNKSHSEQTSLLTTANNYLNYIK
jgi:deoxyribodipyrimidine photolyase-related protein